MTWDTRRRSEKLSKRHGAVSLEYYKDEGYLPEAMLNFLARLGWAHGDAEVFSAEELVGWFDLSGISASPARFNPEKLSWLNAEHIKRASRDRLGTLLTPFLAKSVDIAHGPAPADVADAYRERVATLAEMADAAHYLYRAPHVPAELAEKHLTPPARALLSTLKPRLATSEWTREALLALLKAFATEQGVKLPQLMMPLRVALSGGTSTPSLDAVLAVLGRERTLERLDALG